MQVPRSKKSYGICMHLPESCLVTTLFRLAKTNAEACSGKYWHSRNQKQIPLQHGAQISCSAWYRGPLYSFLEFGPGGSDTQVYVKTSCVQTNCKSVNMQVPRSKKSYGICIHLPESCLVTTLFRLAKTNAEACSGKYWHSRNQKQIPLQHGAQISCSAWYRGPLYSFLEFGPGGPTRKCM